MWQRGVGGRYRTVGFAMAVAALLLAGCASNVEVREALRRSPEAAVMAAEGNLPSDPGDFERHLLDLYAAGDAHRIAGDPVRSLERFQQAEAVFDAFDREGRVLEVLENAAALATNDYAITYRGYEFEGILLNTYKALNLLAMGEFGAARTEFLRAHERQGRAVERFEDEIRRALDRRDSDLSPANQRTTDQLRRQAGGALSIDRILRERYSGVEEWEVYEDFVNPFSSYLQGLYFMLQPESQFDWSSRSSQALRRAYAMVPRNEAIAEDFLLVERLADGETRLEDVPPTVWVFVENGFGPTLSSFTFTVPLRIDGVPLLIPIALPVYEHGRDAVTRLEAVSAEQVVAVQEVADINAIVRTEFRKRLPAVIARAVAAGLVKGAAQYFVAREGGGELALLLTQATSVASAQADTRMWTTLPNSIAVARLNPPPGGQITLRDGLGKALLELSLGPERFHWVYVRFVGAGQTAQATVIAFPEVNALPAL